MLGPWSMSKYLSGEITVTLLPNSFVNTGLGDNREKYPTYINK